MDEIKLLLNDVIVTMLGLLATAICGIGTVYINRLIKLADEKVNSIKGEDERKLISGAILGLDNLINSTVIALNETLVKDIKKMNEDGKLNEDDIKEIKTSLIELIDEQISPNGKELIKKQINDVDSYIDIQAEKYLLQLKQNILLGKNVIK